MALLSTDHLSKIFDKVKSLITESSGIADGTITEAKLATALLAKINDTPTKVSQLTNDSGYAKTTEVNTLIANAIAEVVGGADASFDTLKEIADWILAHPESVAALNSVIQANTSAIAERKIKDVADNTPLFVSEDGKLKFNYNTINEPNTNTEGLYIKLLLNEKGELTAKPSLRVCTLKNSDTPTQNYLNANGSYFVNALVLKDALSDKIKTIQDSPEGVVTGNTYRQTFRTVYDLTAGPEFGINLPVAQISTATNPPCKGGLLNTTDATAIFNMMKDVNTLKTNLTIATAEELEEILNTI